MYKHWLMKCGVSLFSLEFIGIKASTNEQKQAQKEVVHLLKISEEGIPCNSWLLNRYMEDTNVKQPLMVQCGAARGPQLAGVLPGALMCIHAPSQPGIALGWHHLLPCQPRLRASVLHFSAHERCARSIAQCTERITDQGIASDRSSHRLQGEPIPTVLTALLFVSWNSTTTLSRMADSWSENYSKA